MIPIVIGTGYNAYGIIRSFADRGIMSISVGSLPSCFIGKSKFIYGYLQVADPNVDRERFVADLVTVGEAISPHKGMLFPTHDEQLECIAEEASRLSPWFEMPFSSKEVISSILDKAKFSQICDRAGVPTLHEALVESRDESLQVIEKLRFPLMVKLNSWDMSGVRALGGKNVLCFNREQYEEMVGDFYASLPAGRLLVQEYVADGARLMPNVNGVANKLGELDCVFVSEKVRQHPPRIGTSTSTNSVDPENPRYSDIIEYARGIVKATGFYGLFGIEFKYDERDGVYRVIEMNPRSEYPNYLQTLVGQNMPYHLFKIHQGESDEIPLYPVVKKAGCVELITDRFYSRFLYRLTDPSFALMSKQYRSTLVRPSTPYGLTLKDPLPYFCASALALKKCLASYLRYKLKVPNAKSMADFVHDRLRLIGSVPDGKGGV